MDSVSPPKLIFNNTLISLYDNEVLEVYNTHGYFLYEIKNQDLKDLYEKLKFLYEKDT